MPHAEDMLEMKVAAKRMKSKPNPVIPVFSQNKISPKLKRMPLRLQTPQMKPTKSLYK